MTSDVSITYIGPNSRTLRPRKTKVGTEVAHVTRDSDTTFKVKRSKVNLHLEGAGAYCGGLPHSLLDNLVPMQFTLGGKLETHYNLVQLMSHSILAEHENSCHLTMIDDDDDDDDDVLYNRDRRAELCKVIDDMGQASARV